MSPPRITDIKPFKGAPVCTECKDIADLVGGVNFTSVDNRPPDTGQGDPGCDLVVTGVSAGVDEDGIPVQ